MQFREGARLLSQFGVTPPVASAKSWTGHGFVCERMACGDAIYENNLVSLPPPRERGACDYFSGGRLCRHRAGTGSFRAGERSHSHARCRRTFEKQRWFRWPERIQPAGFRARGLGRATGTVGSRRQWRRRWWHHWRYPGHTHVREQSECAGFLPVVRVAAPLIPPFPQFAPLPNPI